MDYLIQIENLGKRYEDFTLTGINLAVEPGTVVGFIGSNGAGKTTTLKAALGLIAADTGTVRLFGQAIEPRQRRAGRVEGPHRHRVRHLRLPQHLPG